MDRPTTPETPAADVWRATPLARWLLLEGRAIGDADDLLAQLCARLLAQAVPVWRVNLQLRTKNPQVRGTSYVWRRDAGPRVETIPRAHGIERTPAFLDNPMAVIFGGAGALRRRLEGPNPQLDFPLCVELRDQGATDYVAMPLTFSDGTINAITFTADAAGGFSTAHLSEMYDMLPVLGMLLEVFAGHRIIGSLLETYLGKDAARHVLSGEFRLGAGHTIRAAIWYSDLRGFTGMADRLPSDAVIALLNDYLACMVKPIHDQGGQVLKFMGDAVLAIFEIGGGRNMVACCGAALDAAAAAAAAMAALNRRRAAAGGDPLDFGLGLHVGDVMYGNIGAFDRLDFTVIGPAVNEASRIQALSRDAGHRVLASSRFAACCGPGLTAIGAFELRGVSEPQELFAP